MKIEVGPIAQSIFREARRRWGKSHEIGMATEELAETIAAINHMRRDRPGSVENYIEELADACVCNFQMIENNGWWDEFHAALSVSTLKLEHKLRANDSNEGHS